MTVSPLAETMDTMNDPHASGSALDRARVAVYTDRECLPTALRAAADGDIAIIMRDWSHASQIRQALATRSHATTVVVDPGRWRHHQATRQRPLDLPDSGLSPMDLATWCADYRAATNADAIFSPSLFTPAGDWDALRALRDALGTGLELDGSAIGLVATDASMLDQPTIDRFLTELQPLGHLRLGFVFAGRQHALANSARLASLQAVLEQHRGSWLLGVDGLIGSDALAADAGLVGVGVRSGMRWPAGPGNPSNTPFARAFVPGRFHRDLLTYRSPVVFAHWYLNSVPAACTVCGRPPVRYIPSPEGNNEILAHNVHAVADLCRDVLFLPADQRPGWLSAERIEAAENYRELDRSQAHVHLDPTLVALIRRDQPSWTAPAPAAL